VLAYAIGCAYFDRVKATAICAGVLPFLRPDLAAAAGAVLADAMWRRPRREQVGAVMLAIAVAAPWLIWMRIDTGQWIAQTMRARQLFFADGCMPWSEKLWTVALAAGSCVGLRFR
jgi:hypothetical protein